MWDKDGKVTFSEQVSLSWSSITNGPNVSKIDANGMYTGTISANKITAGTITTASIKTNGKWELKTDGSGYLACGKLSWNTEGDLTVEGCIKATSGSIAGFNISTGHIGYDMSEKTSETPQEEWASFSIYRNLFKVGGASGYVIFGDDVLPSSVVYTTRLVAVGQIVCNAAAAPDSYVKQTNIGLSVNVSGGDKNYGISSDSPIKAPSFISTEVALVNLDDDWTMDFSLHNTFIMTSSKAKSIVMPSESHLLSYFGLKVIPEDFGIVLTIKIRKGSKPITFAGLYKGSSSSSSITLSEHDSVQILVSYIDGLRYDVLSIIS